jgi:4'-phosphopantetheinyl transferase
VQWRDTQACNFTIDENINIWRVCVSENVSFIDSFLAFMKPEEIARANRYFHAKDRNRYIISRGLLRNILGNYLKQQPAEVEFKIGPNKKPFVVNNGKDSLQYNISHAGDWILLAISNSDVGADTEVVDNGFDYEEVIKEYFGSEEITYIKQSTPAERFFTLWTRKEALTKATAKGIDNNLKLIPVLDGIHSISSHIISSANDWLISSFKLNNQYVGSIAANPVTETFMFWDIDFSLM